MFARLFAASFAVLLLAGCASMPNPFGTPSQASTAPAPVIPGAASSKDPRVATLTGAGTVALTGSAIGTYMDQEEADLRAALQPSGATVTRAGEQIVVALPSNLAFDNDKAVVKQSFAGVLASVGQLVKKYDKTVVDVYGYSDNQAAEDYNRDLSQRRAVAVATALSNHGVDQRRFFIEGRGSQNPVASNAAETGRAQNRRIEIQISPIVAS